MPRIRFLYDNQYSKTTTVLAASSAASALPVGATQNPDRSYVWRSANNTVVQTIDIDLGAVTAIAAIAVANVRLLGAGVLECYERGDAAAAGAATLVATLPTQDADTRVAFAFFNSQSHRHWQLKWTNPTAVNDYAEVGYVFLGTYVEPTVNVSAPSDLDYDDPSIGTPSVDGQESFTVRTRFASGTWEFYYAPEALLTSLRIIYRAVGVHTPIFVVLDTTLTWTGWLCRFVGGIGHRLEDVAGRYTLTCGWKEAR